MPALLASPYHATSQNPQDSQISFSMIQGWSACGGPTMVGTTWDWEAELRGWLEPFLERLCHKARQRMCPLYVAGLIGPGDRKSVQPMAERLAPNDYDHLHHFIAGGVWDAAPLERELLIQADGLVGGSDAVLVVDDTAVPKKGKHSVGVAAQYASALGKNANCQALVSLTLARGEVPVMVALRLFLPENWTSVCPFEASRRSNRISSGTDEAGDRPGGDRSHDLSRCPLRLCIGGCRLRNERVIPPGAHGSQACLGCWYPSSPQGVPRWRAADLADNQSSRPAP
jgi:DDE superfamily endonuclease